jgi:hypothetical protein
MKKVVLAMAAALMMSMGTMAQDEQQQRGNRPERRQMNQTEMVQRRTQHTVERYGLNEDQAKQLLELNKKYAGQMGRQGGRRMGGPRHRMEMRTDSTQRGRLMPKDSLRMRPQPDMRREMEAYDAELQKIMTEEQFKAYKDDQQKRFQQRGGQRPQRQHRDNDHK